jgi:hypothetical protein
MKAHETFLAWEVFQPRLKALELALNTNDVGVIRLMMQELVTGYNPETEIVDWVYLQQEAQGAA